MWVDLATEYQKLHKAMFARIEQLEQENAKLRSSIQSTMPHNRPEKLRSAFK